MSITTTVSAMEMRQSFGALLNRVQYAGERITIARQGKPVAALVSWAELQRLERLEEERELALVDTAKELIARAGAVSFSALLDQYTALHGEPLELPDHV
jgi:prevent-host-death family protein